MTSVAYPCPYAQRMVRLPYSISAQTARISRSTVHHWQHKSRSRSRGHGHIAMPPMHMQSMSPMVDVAHVRMTATASEKEAHRHAKQEAEEQLGSPRDSHGENDRCSERGSFELDEDTDNVVLNMQDGQDQNGRQQGEDDAPTQKGHKRQARQLSWGSLAGMADLSFPTLSSSGLLGGARRVLEDVGICMSLAWKLWWYLGMGYKWTMAFYSLLLYAMFLLPGFIQMIIFYFFSPRVLRSIPYGRGPRQRLDMYLPKGYNRDQTYPVVIFVTGGAWTIGYKAWGALLARRLSGAGVLVASLDYRNFPQGNALQMLEDVNTGIAWMCEKCGRYQGDPDNIVLVSQSAGGQLAALALLKQAEAACGRMNVVGSWPSWQPSDLRGFVGISGAYDLEGLQQHLHRRGLYKNLFRQIMSIEGETSFDELSPLTVARGFTNPCAKKKEEQQQPDGHEEPYKKEQGQLSASQRHKATIDGQYMPHPGSLAPPGPGMEPAPSTTSSSSNSGCSMDDAEGSLRQFVQLNQQQGGLEQDDMQKRHQAWVGSTPFAANPGGCMPPVLLIHGTDDNSVPHTSSTQLYDALTAAGVDCTLRLVEGKSHTSFLLEGPMSGGRDILVDCIMPLLQQPDDISEAKHKVLKPRTNYPALCPPLLCWLAGKVCPF